MLFSSIPFLYYYLPVVLIAYYLAPKSVKNGVLLLASLVFYGWGEPAFVFLMMATIAIGYVFGIIIEKFKQEKYREKPWAKFCMIISVGICLGLLGYFKYANFFIRNINVATGMSVPLLKVVLPIGISFYTFQLVSYLIDVYWGKVTAQKNPIILATYITMFPQLIAGPIVRYSDVEKQLKERDITFDKIAYGIRRFSLGLGKKILIANVLGEFCAAFKATDEKSIVFFWAYAIAVSLQIYFDFSGYSDMAIGLGSMLGFHFIENFNYPFIANSITDFWRRWHISLSSFLKDYVYIPLGGNRLGALKQIRNIFIVWFLTGFWHGAAWNFIIWGIYFGIILIIEKNFLLEFLKKHKIFSHIYTMILIIISFVIFNANSFTEVLEFMKNMFGLNKLPFMNNETIYYLKSYSIMILISVIASTPLLKNTCSKLKDNNKTKKIMDILEIVFIFTILILVTSFLIDSSFNPFLYFRF